MLKDNFKHINSIKIVTKKIHLKISFILITLLFFSSCNSQQRTESEIFVIPKDYVGVVYIFFDQENGISTEYDYIKRRIYQIPKSGILETQFLPNYGATEMPLYYEEAIGEKKMNYLKKGESLDSKEEKVVAWHQTGTARSDPYDENSKIVHFIKFYVCKPSELIALDIKSSQIDPVSLLSGP